MPARSLYPDISVGDLSRAMDGAIVQALDIPIGSVGAIHDPQEVPTAWLPHMYALYGFLELYSETLDEDTRRRILAKGFRWNKFRTTDIAYADYADAIQAHYYYQTQRDATSGRVNRLDIFIIPNNNRVVTPTERIDYITAFRFLSPLVETLTVTIIAAFSWTPTFSMHYQERTRQIIP